MVINSRVMSGGHNLRENWRNRQWTRARNILSSGTKCATICELSSHLLSSRSIVDISAALFCVAHSRMLIPEKRLNLHIEQRDQFARCESHVPLSRHVCLGYVYATRRRPLASNRIYPAALSAPVVHRLLYSRATPYSTWQDDFSYDKYSDRAAPRTLTPFGSRCQQHAAATRRCR